MFTISGVTRDGGREAAVTWWEPEARRLTRGLQARRGLSGDEVTVLRAITDEALGERFDATVTGPSFVGDLDDPRAALVQLGSYFSRIERIDGAPPRLVYPVPPGAAA